jgi:hypothetical protein
MRRFTLDCLCVLLLGDGVKVDFITCRTGKESGRRQEKFIQRKGYTTDDEVSRCVPELVETGRKVELSL